MVVTCAISLGCTNREVYHWSQGLHLTAGQFHLLTVCLGALLSWGKGFAAASGTGIWVLVLQLLD